MAKGKFKQKKKRAPLWYYAVVTLLSAVFLYCAWHLADYWLNSKRQADAYADLAAMVEAARPTAPRTEAVPEGTAVPGETAAEEIGETIAVLPEDPVEDQVNEAGILVEYAPLYEMNPDMAGWIAIDGTKINYPVMHTPDRKDHYLQRSFDGNYSAWGCIYAWEDCDLEAPSDNVTLFGHHMKDGSMFAGLDGYMEQEFWEEHQFIRFDTLREHHTYAVFAVFTTTASKGKGFAYHEFVDAADEDAFDAFIAQCLSLSAYDTGIRPEYGDKILCLSTCEYSQQNGRLVVAAVRIDCGKCAS